MWFRHYATWNTERPLCCFSSQLRFLPNRGDPSTSELLSRLFQLFPDSIVSPRAHLSPSATASCYFMRSRLSCWTPGADLSEKYSLEGPHSSTIGFQFSGPRGGFPFKNVSLVNMSPGWKVIPWKTGRTFFLKTCCWSLSPRSPTPTTHTHTVEGEACRSSAKQRYCLSARSSPGVLQRQFSALSLYN